MAARRHALLPIRRAARMSASPVLPPYAGPDAIELSGMAKKFTLRGLNNEGYINCDVESTTGQLERAYGHGTVLRYADEAKGHRYQDEPFHIHPCLQRYQWEDLDDMDWAAILPSVELASRFLDDPAITPFFAGLLEEDLSELDDSILVETHNKKFYRWDYDHTVIQNQGTMEDTLYTMMSLRQELVLRFGKLAHYGETGAWKKDEELCVITLNEDALHILREDPGFESRRWSQPWAPGTDEASARLRTRYTLAVTIVHEFAHALWATGTHDEYFEPDLRDRPYNELGFELEHMILSGTIQAIEDPAHISAPYGLYIERYPGQWTTVTRYPRGNDPRDWGVRWCTDYPIHMDFVKKMFTKEFWDEEVARYGFVSCRPERRKGIRCYRGFTVEDDPLEEGLSPKSLALHRLKKAQRAKVIRDAVRADDVDASDKEDEGEDGFVIKGSHKLELKMARREAEEDGDWDDEDDEDYVDNDIEMEDAP